jgi:hypothetical protein
MALGEGEQSLQPLVPDVNLLSILARRLFSRYHE